MDITAIICEYHMFHNGHLRQIGWIRRTYPQTTILALMSGNFVQRGEAAIYSADARAKVAVACGVDLVLELPFPYAMSAARFFATGSVRLLAALGVTRFCFGSENGDLSAMQSVAKNLTSVAYQRALSAALAEEKHRAESSVRLGERVYTELFGKGYPSTPNDILGISYLIACIETDGAPTPVTLIREGKESATASRAAIRARDFEQVGRLLPNPSISLAFHPYVKNEAIGDAMLAWYRLADPKALEVAADFTPGDGYRVREVALEAKNYEELCAGMGQKRFTDARVRRMLWYGMIGVREADLKAPPAYTVLLAANGVGREALRILHKESKLPILTKRADYKQHGEAVQKQFALALRAMSLYELLCPGESYLRATPYMA